MFPLPRIDLWIGTNCFTIHLGLLIYKFSVVFRNSHTLQLINGLLIFPCDGYIASMWMRASIRSSGIYHPTVKYFAHRVASYVEKLVVD